MLDLGLGLTSPAVLGRGGAAYDPVDALGADLLAYWEADRIDLITKDGSDRVSSWKDVVAAYDVVQATDGSKPVYAATGFNGAPCLTLDGTADRVAIESTPLPTGGDTCEVWILGAQSALPADTSARIALGWGSSTNGGRRNIGRAVSGGVNRLFLRSGNGTADTDRTGSAVDLSGNVVMRGVWSASAIAGEVNGTSEGSSAVTLGGTGTTRTVVGGRETTPATLFWQGSIAAILVTQLLDSDQAAALRAWLMTRAGL